MPGAQARPVLTVVTVVYNDWPGLARTLESVWRLPLGSDVEHWVIDGGTDGEVASRRAEIAAMGSHSLHEPDAGLYDAMNKGIERAHGDYVLFINAGDLIDDEFSVNVLRPFLGSGRVLVGYSVERWGNDLYLRPGLGMESRALEMPPHQSTFYPRTFYERARYALDRPLGADGQYTARAVQCVGALFIGAVVCEFEIGGRSTTYTLAAVITRWKEQSSARARVKTLSKAVMWRVLPRSVFYRMLARGKFTRIGARPAGIISAPIELSVGTAGDPGVSSVG